jgi:hypothetical protein
MFQILEFSIAPNERVVIDDKLKTQYKGITGMTVWTPDHNKLRLINLELKIDGKKVLPAGFPSELFSVNPFRNVEDCKLKMDFPELSKIEGGITNGNSETVTVKLIFFIKL